MGGSRQHRLRVALAATTLVAVSAGCAGESPAVVGGPVAEEVADLTVVSDDQQVTTGAACIAEIPDDLSDCPGYEDAVARLELDETRKGALVVPAEVATGGYQVEVGGAPLPGMDGTLGEEYQVFRVPAETVAQPGPTTLTVEALRSTAHPQAVWRFLLDDPAQPPA